MRIVIVGGGISGLTCYLFLRKLIPSILPTSTELDITIIESHAATNRRVRPNDSVDEAAGPVATTIGSALGLAPNGLAVLRDLDETLYREVANSGYPVSHFHLANALGWSLARLPATNQNDPQLHTVLISRQRLWDCLRMHVPDSAIADQCTVSGVTYTGDQRPIIKFSDDIPDLAADLVIGADGAKSVVKKSITGDGKTDQYPAVFDGLTGVGGFVSSSQLPENEPRGRMTVTFGAHGFFGYGASTVAPQSNHFAMCTAPKGDEAVWWSTYETTDVPDTRSFDKDDILRQLKARHAGWKDATIKQIVDEAVIDSIYPTYITPELPTWQTRGLVLVGDAAHAMQPSSGQGAAQGLEDAQVFSMLLAHYLERHFSQSAARAGRRVPTTAGEAVDQASKKYFEIRKPRVTRIVHRAKQMGDTKRKKGIVGEWFTYLILWIIGKLPTDAFTRNVYNDLPVNEVKKVIEQEKAPAPTFEHR
ncbi:MAG: hypothetical protein LQ352_007817 [Teloschistes flavicans]|nr:MAG: hypothetical protein LQ352_007817 [Teloschistes flavicans]